MAERRSAEQSGAVEEEAMLQIAEAEANHHERNMASQNTIRVPLFAARTLNATGPSRVTLSLLQAHFL